MLRSCVGGARLTMTVGRRSCAALFDWYSSLAPGGARGAMPWPDVLQAARAAFPARGKADYHLCLSHNTRKRVNKLVQRQRARPGGLRLEGKQPLGQTMWVQGRG